MERFPTASHNSTQCPGLRCLLLGFHQLSGSLVALFGAFTNHSATVHKTKVVNAGLLEDAHSARSFLRLRAQKRASR